MKTRIARIVAALVALGAVSACSFAPSQQGSMDSLVYAPSVATGTIQTDMVLESY